MLYLFHRRVDRLDVEHRDVDVGKALFFEPFNCVCNFLQFVIVVGAGG